MNKEGENPFDIWPAPLEIDEFSAAPEPETEDAEDAKLPEEAGASAKAEPSPEPDVLDRLGVELDDLADGKDTSNSSKAIKGLQRVIARKDNEVAALRQQQAETLARQAMLEEQLASLNVATTLNWQVLNNNLEDESKRDAEIALLRKQEQYRQEQQARAQQRQQATVQRAPEPEAWETSLAAAVELEAGMFETGLQELAQLVGVDPKNPVLDYGEKNETFNQRMKRFNSSLDKAKRAAEENEVKAVRGTAVTTRGANGGEAPVTHNGMSNLQMGAAARSAQFRNLIAFD